MKFSCKSGLTLVGMSSITCLHTGTWDNSPPACQYLKCPDILSVVKVRLRLGSSGKYLHKNILFQDKTVKVTPLSTDDGGKVLFSCPRGYTLEGDNQASCQTSNTWSIKVRNNKGKILCCPWHKIHNKYYGFSSLISMLKYTVNENIILPEGMWVISSS